MPLITVRSFAKLNLALEVKGRRADGFHELSTVFERVSLNDTLSFAVAQEGKLSIFCDHPGVPCDERNLVHKAARLLQQGEGVTKGAMIRIRKRIPVAAGLAGGSGNGAAALIGLNRLWRLRLSQADLLRYAKVLGSDVAFFLYDASFALGTGRGEKIKVLGIKDKFWHVLITPVTPLLTKDVYAALDLRCGEKFKGHGSNAQAFVRVLGKGNLGDIQKTLFNDLEGGILKVRPSLLKLKKKLARFAPNAVCFSGSGPSVFAITNTKAEADAIARKFSGQYSQTFVVRTV